MLAHRAALLVALASLTACAHPRVGVSPTGGAGGGGGGGGEKPGDESCLLSTGNVSGHSATITVGLSDSVDPHDAPFPRNDAERIVFRHLYERPVRIDCDGHGHAELADKWSKEDDGRRWTFQLRDDAQYWDGVPVTAQDIVFGKGGVGYTLSAPENRVVAVTFAKQQDDLPPVLGDPGLAVMKPAPDSSWPIGTGAYWATAATTTAKEIRARTTRGDTLVFTYASDARDLLDAGVDLLVTRDPALREYAATLQNRAVIPLPWDRTYIYVTAEAGGTRFDGLEQSVRADARRPDGGFWWLDLKACGVGQGSSPPASTGQKRILYSRTDPTARELAGRLAALTHGVATGRSPDDFSAALMRGRDWGYIVALPRATPDPCRSAKDLLPPWSATFTALIETRATAIARRGVARWVVDQDGTVHLAP
jgi:hypothetical protein